MLGSTVWVTATAESTTDGVNMDTMSVPAFMADVYANCLVTVNETTIISFGGLGSLNLRRVAVFTTGSSAWEVSYKYYSKGRSKYLLKLSQIASPFHLTFLHN